MSKQHCQPPPSKKKKKKKNLPPNALTCRYYIAFSCSIDRILFDSMCYAQVVAKELNYVKQSDPEVNSQRIVKSESEGSKIPVYILSNFISCLIFSLVLRDVSSAILEETYEN